MFQILQRKRADAWAADQPLSGGNVWWTGWPRHCHLFSQVENWLHMFRAALRCAAVMNTTASGGATEPLLGCNFQHMLVMSSSRLWAHTALHENKWNCVCAAFFRNLCFCPPAGTSTKPRPLVFITLVRRQMSHCCQHRCKKENNNIINSRDAAGFWF